MGGMIPWCSRVKIPTLRRAQGRLSRKRREKWGTQRFSEETVNFGRHSKSTTRTRQREAADAGVCADLRCKAGVPAIAQEIYAATSGATAAEPAGTVAARSFDRGGHGCARSRHSGQRSDQAGVRRNGDRRRERSLPDHLLQSRRTGEILDLEEVR